MSQQPPTSKNDRGRASSIATAIVLITLFFGFGYQNFSGDGTPLSFPSKNVRFLIPQNTPPEQDPCERSNENFAVDFKFAPEVGVQDIASIQIRLNGEAVLFDHPQVPSVSRECSTPTNDPQTVRICGKFANVGYANYEIVHIDGRRLSGLHLLSLGCSAAPQPFPGVLFGPPPTESSRAQ